MTERGCRSMRTRLVAPLLMILTLGGVAAEPAASEGFYADVAAGGAIPWKGGAGWNIEGEIGTDLWQSPFFRLGAEFEFRRTQAAVCFRRAHVHAARGSARPRARQQPSDRDVLVDLGPVNALAAAEQLPSCELGRRRVTKSREPVQRHAQSPTVAQDHDELSAPNANIRDNKRIR